MPRSLKNESKNSIVLQDTVTNEEVKFYYRRPESSEIVRYQSKVYRAGKGGQIEIDGDLKVEMAMEILTGFEKGFFLDENDKVFSSDAMDTDYRSDWKEMVQKLGSDLLLSIASVAYESTRRVEDSDFLDRN